MAVNPDDVDDITDRTAALYREAESAILDTIRRHLARGIDSPTWAEDRLAAVGQLRRAAQAIVGGLAADASDEIRAGMASAYRTGRGSATRGLAEGFYPRSGLGQRGPRPVRSDVVESLAAALIRDVGNRTANVLRHVEDVYRGTIAAAVARSVAGGLTRRQASQQAWQRFVDEGVSSFVDSAGRRWRLSTYSEMAVRTVTARAAIQGQTDRLAAMGLDLVLVSDHAQECKRCRPWEGKILRTGDGETGRVEAKSAIGPGTVTVDVAGTLTAARQAGFQHPNCRHSVRAYLPGATKPPARPTPDPEGDAARTRQRDIERQIRRWKEQQQAALDPVAARNAGAKVRAWQERMRDHLAAHPKLKRQPHREQIGAGSAPRGGRVAPAGRARGADMQLGIDGTETRFRRTRRPAPAPDQPAPDQPADVLPGQAELDFTAAADPLDQVDLANVSDDELYDLFNQAAEADDGAALARIGDEMDRRDREGTPPAVPDAADPDDAWLSGPSNEEFDWPADEDLTPEQVRIDELVESGRDYLDAYAEVYGLDPAALARQAAGAAIDRRAGETLDQAVRRAYDEWVHVKYLEAEDATAGVLLNRAGVAAGIDPRELFSGPIARARKYASEELQRWWVENDRLNFTQFKAQVLGRESDRQAAQRTRLQSNDQDFV